MLLAAIFCAYLPLAVLIDARALPRGPLLKRTAFAWTMSILALTLLYGFWFVLTWRPILSLVTALITLAVIVHISNLKYRDVLEPLNFLDFALIPQIVRHPRLYRAEILYEMRFWVVVVATIAVVVAWCVWIEYSILPAAHRPEFLLAAFLFSAGVISCLLGGPLPRGIVDAVNSRMLPVDCARHVFQMGLAGSFLGGLIGWRQTSMPSRSWPAQSLPSQDPAPLVLVVQCESFVDLARSGVRDVVLPGLKDAREQSAAHGRMIVPVQGAWTLRCEFSFLTGQPLTAFGFDALHPYLRLRKPPRTLADHFRDIGFHNIFMHPFDLDFFNRKAAMPLLGFDRLVGEDEFPKDAIDGFYISDLTVADRILDIAAQERRPLFCFAATMENHNPWNSQRLPNLHTAADKYIYHLRNSDRMIARLLERLPQLQRPVIFAFYGDHVPTLPSLANPFPDTSTDYFVAGLQDGHWLTGSTARDLHLHELSDTILDVFAGLRTH